MPDPRHSKQTLADGIHGVISYAYADESARLAATGFDAGDLYKQCIQLSDLTTYILTQVSPPVWTAVGSLSLTTAAPTNVTKAAASAGVSTEAARADHKHDITTAAPGTVEFGAASEGSSTALARADHVHAMAAPAAPTQIQVVASAAGSSPTPARSDHTHSVLTAAANALAIGAAAAEGSSASLARSDHTHAFPAPAAPVSVGTANDAGVATTAARADHVHAHGDLPGGTLHAVATPSVAGFMSAADKAKLDGIPSGGGSVFGSEAQNLEQTSALSTTSTNFLQYMRLTTTSVPAGTYRIEWMYLWSYTSTALNFVSRVQVDDTITVLDHAQEPQDAATSQRNVVTGFAYVTFGASGTHDIDIDFRSSGAATATIHLGRLAIWRVS